LTSSCVSSSQNNQVEFGGLGIVVCLGDFFQLSPVKSPYLIFEPTNTDAGRLFSSFQSHPLSFQMRARGDVTLTAMLNDYRSSSCSNPFSTEMFAAILELILQDLVNEPRWALAAIIVTCNDARHAR
jgi:hypothetical protein